VKGPWYPQEFIASTSPNTIFITIGLDDGVFVVDPLANLFSPLLKVGTRCD
jgi:hypothetical protein